MGSSESSQRQISVKNEDFKLPPVQITREVYNRLQEHASRSPPPLVPEDTLSSEDSDPFNDSTNTKEFLRQENVLPAPAALKSISSPDDYFPFKSDTNYMDPLNEDNWERYITKPDYVVLGVGPTGLPAIETVTASQVRKEMQEELLSNDFFWSSKIQKLMDHYTTAVEFAHEEFSKKSAEIHKTVPILRNPNGCQTLMTMLGHCYIQNPKQVLKCSDIVKQFTRCVDCEVAMGRNALQPMNQNQTVKKGANKRVKSNEQ